MGERCGKFDLVTLQGDSDHLPSLATLQSGARLELVCVLELEMNLHNLCAGSKAPSLQDIQMERPGLPSLNTFQSDETLDRLSSQVMREQL